MIEYKFVCLDAKGVWQDLRYATLTDESEARAFSRDLLNEFAAVVVYEGDRNLTLTAQLT